MQRRISVLLTILVLSLTAALLGTGTAFASPPDPPGGTTDSQTTGGGDDDGGGGGPTSDPCDLYTPTSCMEGPPSGGGGGGGGGGEVVPPGLPSPQEAQKTVDNARLDVRKAIVDKPKCFETLSRPDSRSPDDPRNPIKVLDTVSVLFVNQSTSAAAYASGSGVTGTISVLPGFFFLNFDPNSNFGYVNPDVYFDLPTVQVSVKDLQLVALLHELGHLTGVNFHLAGKDGAEPTPGVVNRTFNTQIYVNCLDQGAIYQ